MILHPGVLLSPATCAAIAPVLEDLAAQRSVQGRPLPPDVRSEIAEVARIGAAHRRNAQLRESDVRPGEHAVVPACSSPAPLYVMTCAEVATELRVTERAVQRRAERGTLPARRVGREWRFDAEQIERLTTKGRNAR